MYRKCLVFLIWEILCFDLNCIIGIELKICNGCVYILGVYLFFDNNVDNYVYELNLFENLYNYYLNYGKVIIVGDLNGSLVDLIGINEWKLEILLLFVFRKNFCIFYIDFKICGKNYIFIYKKIILDYVLFDKFVLILLYCYLIYVEGLFLFIFDYFLIIVIFNLCVM